MQVLLDAVYRALHESAVVSTPRSVPIFLSDMAEELAAITGQGLAEASDVCEGGEQQLTLEIIGYNC